MTLTAEQQAYVRAVVAQIEGIEAQIKELNADKSAEYQGAKAKGLDVPALRALIAKRRKMAKDSVGLNRIEELLADYEHAMDGASRVHAREEAA